MKRKQVRRSAIFLLELMTAILFFSLASAVCVRLFIKSQMVSEDTRNLNMALSQVSAAADVFRSGMDMGEFLGREFPEYEERSDGSEFFVYYDREWETCRQEDAEFSLTIRISRTGSGAKGRFSMKKLTDDEEIYGVSLETYTGEGTE